MASLLVARGLHALITSRESAPKDDMDAWGALVRRDSEDPHVWRSVGVFVWFMANLAIFLPVLLFLSYTLSILYPTLAIVEDADAPPQYELVSGSEIVDSEDNGKVGGGSNAKDIAIVPDNSADGKGTSSTRMADETAGLPPTSSKPVTTGLLATLRLLRANGGLFKAFRWRFLHNALFGIVLTCVAAIPYVPDFVACLIATLAAAKVQTAWTHAAISAKHEGRTWSNLPSFIIILKAMALPVVVQSALIELVTLALYLPLGPRKGSVDSMGIFPQYENVSFTKLSIILLIMFALYSLLILPTEVVLVRVQASFLPADTTTVVQLDESIRVQKIEETGFMSWTHAWRTFSRPSWFRLIKVQAKVLAATFVTELVAIGLIFAQFVIVAAVTGQQFLRPAAQ